ncbi:TrmH family RNA methyltransferase [Leadbettera azotonutricia]|uniref:RNA methyltransferase, TrmH family n=1 Tax=Leadbettera azotonutricia (strain ATCC BAA-888 / DSM 13862 / ZAS-9) TaxID=545695 RepID=F5Y7Y2_LEAAZ|nr:TrmH family RNA methyltransferase [Leadbettera azotonutricia]AEF82499.1 RNA methyltransferase, TrmH family [Leadbettera azotonutricia ZAS-9]
MIPLYKLERLPRPQRLRKIAKMFAEAEQRLVLGGALPPDEMNFLADALKALSGDGGFAPAVLEALSLAQENITQQAEQSALRRAINSARHLLLAETGHYPAEWDFDLKEASGSLDKTKRRIFSGMQAYFEDIRSPFNVGAMFRTAECFGAEKIWLSPFCADPGHPRAQRTAMGCIDALPWEKAGLAGLEGPFFALETGGIPLEEFPFPLRGIMIAGSEELGVSPEALAAADASLGRVGIPSFGAKGSLNVSTAFGIAMQAWSCKLNNYGGKIKT